MDQSTTPYLDALVAFAGSPRTAFHVPGHIQGRGAHRVLHDRFGSELLELDLCSGLDRLDDALVSAQRLAADVYGADRSWFLVNGSTIGNQVMLCATCRPGDLVLTSRNTHKSIVSALVVSGARPVYLAPELDADSHLAHGVAPATVEAALDAHPDAKAVLIVSPTYYGVCSDVAGIAEVCHGRDVPLLVDEAWGAHFPFHPKLPTPALVSGADAAVTGTHKLLGALTQASMLHVKGRLVDERRVDVVLDLLQTTSPSCLLYAALDVARMQMATEGTALLDQALSLATEARRRLQAHRRLSCLDDSLVGTHAVVDVDPTRLCIDVVATGHTGYEIERLLAERYAVDVELSDFAHVLANITIAHREADTDRLCAALEHVAGSGDGHALDRAGFIEQVLFNDADQALSPAEAFHAPKDRIPLGRAAGRISAELVAAYPPGIPATVPGERLTPELIEYLSAQIDVGGRVVGPEDPTLATISVVAE